VEARGTGRWLALAAITLAVVAVALDGTVLSVALPTLAGALHASEAQLQWFTSGYALVLAAAMLPAGLLGDRYGRKRVMLGALLLFAVGSIACAFAPSPAAFTAARLVLGLAGAPLIVMALAAVTVLFTAEERPRAVANFVALPIGPILGGWLAAHPLLVGLGVSHQRAGRPDRLRRGGPACPRVACGRAAQRGRSRGADLQRRPRPADLRPDPGGREGLGRRGRQPHGRRPRGPRGPWSTWRSFARRPSPGA